MRETRGRNAKEVEAVRKFGEEKTSIYEQWNWMSVHRNPPAEQYNTSSRKRGLDVIIHNAGHMVFGPAEAFRSNLLSFTMSTSSALNA